MTKGNHHSLYLGLQNRQTGLLGWYLGARYRRPRRYDYESSSLGDVNYLRNILCFFLLQADLIRTLEAARNFRTDGEQG